MISCSSVAPVTQLFNHLQLQFLKQCKLPFFSLILNKHLTLMQKEETHSQISSKRNEFMKKRSSSEHDIFDSVIRGSILSEFEQEISNDYQHAGSTKEERIKQAFHNSHIAWSIPKKDSKGSKVDADIEAFEESLENENVDQICNLVWAYSNPKSQQKGSQLKSSQSENKSTGKTLEGVLLKESPGVFGSWDRRYCRISGSKFVYHETEKPSSSLAGTLNFNLMAARLITESSQTLKYFRIKVTDSEKQFVFKGNNEEETRKWADELNKRIESSLGKQYNMTYLAHYHRFWRKDYISEKELRQCAQTGDLILFRGNKTSSIMQRVITMEEYDHIAVVLLNTRGDILLFQANGGVGVGLCPWNKFVTRKWFADQDLVVYRKLNAQRTQALLQEIQDFVEINMGKKYKFSFKKYLMSRETEVNAQKNSFFCSSLVAKLYKSLGWLDKKKSSSQYMPYDFSEKNKLEMKVSSRYGKATLEPEKIIVFEEQFFKQ